MENGLIFEVTQWGKYYYHLHLTDKETKAQKIDLPRPWLASVRAGIQTHKGLDF